MWEAALVLHGCQQLHVFDSSVYAAFHLCVVCTLWCLHFMAPAWLCWRLHGA
jgi:hypothetical protein